MKHFKLGKRAAARDHGLPHLSHLMKMVRPAPAVNWAHAVTSWPMLKNDAIGDCTAAAVLHQIQCWRANNGSMWTPTDAQAVSLYSATSGYPKSDSGAVEADVLAYWEKTGVQGDGMTDKATFAHLFEKDLNDLKLSIQYFGGVYLGIELPLSAQDQKVWDVLPDPKDPNAVPNSWGGHAVIAVAYDQDTFSIVTWGGITKATGAFLQKYCDEAYAVISPEWLSAKGISPPGLNMAQLLAEQASLKD